MKNDNNKKRKILTAITCVMLAAVAVGGTLAYFTSTEEATNKFKTGNVQIDLIEPHFPGNGSDKVKNLVPNAEVPKDPKVVNTGVNDAIVFMKVDVPKKAVRVVNDDGTTAKDGTSPAELFELYKGDNVINGKDSGENWILIKTDEKGTDYNTYIYGYKTTVVPEDKEWYISDGVNDFEENVQPSPENSCTDTLFDTVKLANITEKIDEELNVKVTAYAIQADELIASEDINISSPYNVESLKEVYRMFFNQNENADGVVVSDEAHNNNKYNIPQGNAND